VVLRPYVTGKITAQPKPGSGSSVDPTARFDRPVPIGVSTGHPDITAGTIGARVVDSSGNVYALSNNHVYANENIASINDAVIQPGTFDGGSLTGDSFGTLADFVPIDFSGTGTNIVDAAIAAVADGDLAMGTPEGGYGEPSSTTVAAIGGLNVRKYGRTTGQTDGRVDAVNATVNIGYDTGTALFVGQVIIKGRKGSFSAGGDSGSLIVTKDGSNPVALLFAGNSTVTIANPIDDVLSAFGVTIDDGSGPAPPQNDAPVVTITGPDNDSSYDIGVATDFSGTANDTEDGNVTGNILWTSNLDGSIGSGGIGSAFLSLGTHTISASVTDLGGKTGSASITVVVIDPNAVIMTMSVGSIDFSERRKGRGIDLSFTISIVDEGGLPVSGAAITSVLSRPGASWNINGTTGAEGTISSKLRNAIDGTTYTVTVNNVTHNVLVFADGPSSTESWLVGGPN
jgi:hypothetical protein